MKIKDIRQFRNLYKNEIREIDSSNRNEHFVGVRTEVNGKSQYGFFEIYHGDKEGFNESDGIRGFLEGFLDMAKDGQAVYEFMQNAVDAKSSKFCLFWGKDEVDGNTYLLVINNGEMFNMDSIRSILNVGVSTKSTNNFTIGKFGIGFKLAHRLVGRENGLDELIYQNYGPILFSWQENELLQLESLIDNPEILPQTQEYEITSGGGKRKAIIKTTDPWLFKILITNFPCQPENDLIPEIIHDNQYHETNKAFSRDELIAMGRWIKNYSDYLQSDFKKGSLFFIRLGQGKQSHLEEENLEEGVRFSLAILNKIAKQSLGHEGLQTVNLQGKELAPVDLEFESFIIDKTTDRDEYRFLRFGKKEDLSEVELSKEIADKDIEILLGYTNYQHAKEAFHNAPNFYLFFPLSEEKHRLRFIIHSNAFYKSSSRTYLQKGSVGDEGINERLFRVFVDKLKDRMLIWASSLNPDDKHKFLELYANLLLSDESENPERVWINEPLWQPILKFLESNVPVKNTASDSFTLLHKVENIRIKSTSLPADAENWLEGKIQWFVWDFSEREITIEACRKLRISTFSILDLLQYSGIASKINLWLEKTKYSLVPTILNELNSATIITVKQVEIFWTNLGLLKIWEFDDGYFSLEEIGKEDEYSKRLILFDTLDLMKEQLIKASWALSKQSLSDFSNLFPSIQNRFQSQIKYIRRNEELISVLNLKLTDADLSKADKLNVIKVLAKKLSDDKEDRINKIREIKLFKSTLSDSLPLKSLLKETSISWLGKSVIHSNDYHESLDEYLISKPLDIYQNIIAPHWRMLVSHLSDSEVLSLFSYAKGVFKQNVAIKSLSDLEIIKIGKSFINQTGAFFYSSSLSLFSESEYSILEKALEKLNLQPIPCYDLLKFYEEPPFKISSKNFNFQLTTSTTTSIEEARLFLKFCSKDFVDIFNVIDIQQNLDEEIIVSPKKENIHLVFSENLLVRNYIADHHSELFRMLPIDLKDFSQSVKLQGTPLFTRLTHECDYSNNEQLSALIDIALQSEIEARKILIDKLTGIHFDLDESINADLTSVKFIRLLVLLNDDSLAQKNIKSKVSILSAGDLIKLSEVHLFGNDDVIFERVDKKYTLSLSSILINTDSKATKIVGNLCEKLSEVGVGERQILDKMFGLSGQVDKTFIAAKLKEKYVNDVLDNSDQLAFVLLFDLQRTKDFSADSFKIETNSSSVYLSNIVLYAPEKVLNFIPDSLRLSDKYVGISSSILDGSFTFKGSHGVVICIQPFIENNKLILTGLINITSNEHRIAFIEFVYNQWKEAKEQIKTIDLGENKKWFDFVGFEPFHSIAGSNLILDSEKIPAFVQEWIDESQQESFLKEKFDFLRTLGVSLTGADIVRIRKYLVGEDNEEPNINYSLPPQLIANTLILLSQRKVVFFIGDSRVQLVKELYHRLSDNLALLEIPLPVMSSHKVDSFGFEIISEALTIDQNTIDQLKSIDYPTNQLTGDCGTLFVYSGLIRNIIKLKQQFPFAIFNFDIVDSQKIIEFGHPWDRNFYNEWCKLYPDIQIIIYPGSLPNQLQLNGRNIYSYQKGDCAKVGNQIFLNGELNDKVIINLLETKKLLDLTSLNKLREFFNKYDDSVQDFLNRIQSNHKLRDEFEKLKEREKIEQKKKELSEGIGSNAPYTMKWFMSLLDLMVMSNGGNTLTNQQGNVVFGGLKYDPADLRLVTLTNPSSVISPSIDLFTDFFATFTYLDENNLKRSKQIKISGVSKKGSELVIIPTNGAELNTINLLGVKEIELSFVRILDLLSKLTNAFRNMDLPDEFNFKSELSENIEFIFGPPGTGKTTEISNKVIEQISKCENKKILILTPTNKAADVLVNRILENCVEDDFPESWLVRFGASTDLGLLDRGMIYDGNTFKYHLYRRCVLVTTIQRFPYEKVITSEGPDGEVKTRISEISWDTIIFDEASMIMLPAIVYPLFKRKYTNYTDTILTDFIVGGDPLQIPPIYDISDNDLGDDNEGIKEENIYTMVGLQSFDVDVQAHIPKYGSNFGNKIRNLETQYRSIESIGQIFSRFQYNGDLHHGRKKGLGGPPTPRPLPHFFAQLGFKPVTVIKFPVNTDDAIYNPQKLNNSPFHMYSAFLVNELILRFRKEVTENWNVGVLSPYRPQANLLNRLLETHSDKSKLDLLSDTVHGFQGGECDIVFALFNPSSLHASKSRFFNKEYIINVAVSRARDYLVLLVPDLDNEMQKLPLFHSSSRPGLMNIIDEIDSSNIARLDARDLEKALMGKENYFQDNSFTNVHQSVNVYSNLFKEYIVRYSGSSIDVHIKAQ